MSIRRLRISLFFFFISIVSGVYAQEQRPDAWISLIQNSHLNKAKLKLLCPHFPEYKDQMDATDRQLFNEKRTQWMQWEVDEVKVFLDLPEIRRQNVLNSELGLDPRTYPDKIFPDPYWQFYRSSGITMDDLDRFAPHFPHPKSETPDSTGLAQKVYKAAFDDWTRLFPGEYSAFMNQPHIASHMGRQGTSFFVPITDSSQVYLSLDLKSKEKPIQADFDSDNLSLDKVRYDSYLKKWYWDYDRDGFYRTYRPNEYLNYKMNTKEPLPSNH